MTGDERKSVFVRLDKDLHARMKSYAAAHDMTMRDLVASACQVYMNYYQLFIGRENDQLTLLFKGDDQEEILSILKGVTGLFDGEEKAGSTDH